MDKQVSLDAAHDKLDWKSTGMHYYTDFQLRTNIPLMSSVPL